MLYKLQTDVISFICIVFLNLLFTHIRIEMHYSLLSQFKWMHLINLRLKYHKRLFFIKWFWHHLNALHSFDLARVVESVLCVSAPPRGGIYEHQVHLQLYIFPPGGSSTPHSSLLPWTTTNWKWNYCQSIERMKLCHIVVRGGKAMCRWATGADRAVVKEEEKAWQLVFFVLFYWMGSSLSFTSPIPLFPVFRAIQWRKQWLHLENNGANCAECGIHIKMQLSMNKRNQRIIIVGTMDWFMRLEKVPYKIKMKNYNEITQKD